MFRRALFIAMILGCLDSLRIPDQIFPTTFKASESFANFQNFQHGKSPRMVYGGA